MFIWRSLLQLPENHTAFSSLVDKGTHVAYLNLQKKYPIKSRKLLRVLQRYARHTAAMQGTGPKSSSHKVLLGPCLICRTVLKSKHTHHVWMLVCAMFQICMVILKTKHTHIMYGC